MIERKELEQTIAHLANENRKLVAVIEYERDINEHCRKLLRAYEEKEAAK